MRENVKHGQEILQKTFFLRACFFKDGKEAVKGKTKGANTNKH